MYSAKAIANYFLDKGDVEDVDITPLKIIKLVYIAHGWHLGLKGEPLIADKVEAWDHGPVIPELYHEFKHYGKSPIRGRAYEEVLASIRYDPVIDSSHVEDFLDEVWGEYGEVEAWELSAMTHQPHTPWDITRKKNKFRFKMNPIIENDLIEKFYRCMKDKPYDEFKDEWYKQTA